MNKPDSKLKEIWAKKLKDSGFEDIETPLGGLKRYDKDYFFHPDMVERAGFSRHYYDLARAFLNDYKFDSTLDKTIWEQHSEGKSVRYIAKLLQNDPATHLHRIKIWQTISRLAKEMKALYRVSTRSDTQ